MQIIDFFLLNSCTLPSLTYMQIIQEISTKMLRSLNKILYRSLHVQNAVKKWDIHAAVLVERLPILTQELNDLERKFQALLWQVEYENCLKSNHELQHERELQQTETQKKGQLDADTEESQSKLTAQDKEDAYAEELKAFQSAPVSQHLRDTVYLFVEQQLGKDKLLLLPQGERLEGETLRQTAERVVQEKCGTDLKVQFYGNAPCGFYKYKYPTAVREQSIGAKVFFYRATLQNEKIQEKTKYEWLLKSDIDAKVKTPSEYKENIYKCLF